MKALLVILIIHLGAYSAFGKARATDGTGSLDSTYFSPSPSTTESHPHQAASQSGTLTESDGEASNVIHVGQGKHEAIGSDGVVHVRYMHPSSDQ